MTSCQYIWKIQRSYDYFIFTTWFLIHVKHLYVEPRPRSRCVIRLIQPANRLICCNVIAPGSYIDIANKTARHRHELTKDFRFKIGVQYISSNMNTISFDIFVLVKVLAHKILRWFVLISVRIILAPVPRQNGRHFPHDTLKKEFRLKCYQNVFPRVQLTIFQHWFR